jgi:hypothetical protein
MEKANAFQLRVVLDDGSYFAYYSPPEAVCIQLSSCPHWQAAKSVVWRSLPAHSYVSFFQSENCASRDGDVFSSAGVKVMSGVHTFKTPRAIRSIFTRHSLGQRKVATARQCVQLRHHVEFSSLVVDGGNSTDVDGGFQQVRFDNATVGENETWTGTAEEIEWSSDDESAGLLSNWTEPLPDEFGE